MCLTFQGIYIKSTYDGLHVITGTTENVSADLRASDGLSGCVLTLQTVLCLV